MNSPLMGPVGIFLSRLKHPTLFKLAAGLFLLDLLTPDLIPFITFGLPVDEILMALVTLGLASWKSGRNAPDAAPAPSEGDKKPGHIIEGESRPVD